MKTVGIGIDYSNICKDYNTAYLDRDNKDPDTSRCMNQVLTWTRGLLTDLCDRFGYGIYFLHSDAAVTIDDVASNRFLFYSLEKEITLQSFVAQKAYRPYGSLAAWEKEHGEGILIQNDEDGQSIYIFCEEGSDVHRWLTEKLINFSLDDVPFSTK